MTDVTIPARPSIEFDKKQAKRLLKAVRAGDADAVARFVAFHPRYSTGPQPGSASLSDALLTIAREYGFSSWPEWKHFVEIATLTRSARVEKFLGLVCSDRVRTATQLLRQDATLTVADACAAAATGDAAALAAFIEADPACATRASGPLDTEPLVYACQSRLLVVDPARREGIVECARLLIEAGADPNAGFVPDDPDHALQTALYGAAGIANHPGLTRLLLAAGADPNDGVKGRAGETLYHVAEFGDTTCLELILAAKPDKAAVDYCLGRALDFKRPDAAMLFVEHGADVEYRVPWFENRTHLMKAIRSQGAPGLIEAMVVKATDLELEDDRGFTAYRHAVRAGRGDVAALLERHGADTRKVTDVDRALGACAAGDEATLDALLVRTPDLGARLDDADRELLPAAVRRASKDALRLFVRLGVPVDFGEMPALHDACYVGDFETVKQLVLLGASLTEKNRYGGTALGAALYGSEDCHDAWGGPKSQPPEAVEPRGYARIVGFLIEKGAPPPDRLSGSPAVIEVLQRLGVKGQPDEETE